MSQERALAKPWIASSLLLLLTAPAYGEDPAASDEQLLIRNHPIMIESGEKLAVTEYFTRSSELRQPARAVVFLTGPEFRGSFWTIPVEGYNGPAMAARRGFFAYTLDYVGVGESHRPEDGSHVNYRTNAAALRKLVKFVHKTRQVERVDLVGEGYGGEIASLLAAEPELVRSVTMSTMVYKAFHPTLDGLLSPEREAALRNQPNGYWRPNFLEKTLAHSPNEELRDYVLGTQSGVYPTGPTLQLWDFGLPTIDAAAARVPALIITGELDPFPAPNDMKELAQDWAGGGTLAVIPGASHVPRIESEEIAERYFARLFGFIDPPKNGG